MQHLFDSGWLMVQASGSVPVRLASLNRVAVKLVGEYEARRDQYKFPVNIGEGFKTFSIEAETARFSGLVATSLWFPQASTAATTLKMKRDDTYTIPTSPYQVTVSPGTGATWSQDCGCVMDATGKELGLPNGDTYTVANGVYTFPASLTGQKVRISYLYTVAGGSTLALVNTYRDIAPKFSAVLNNNYEGREMTLALGRCYLTEATMNATLEEFTINNFRFEAVADPSNLALGSLSLSE